VEHNYIFLLGMKPFLTVLIHTKNLGLGKYLKLQRDSCLCFFLPLWSIFPELSIRLGLREWQLVCREPRTSRWTLWARHPWRESVQSRPWRGTTWGRRSWRSFVRTSFLEFLILKKENGVQKIMVKPICKIKVIVISRVFWSNFKGHIY